MTAMYDQHFALVVIAGCLTWIAIEAVRSWRRRRTWDSHVDEAIDVVDTTDLWAMNTLADLGPEWSN